MCTVSWNYSGAGYQLFVNRDELISRQRATPPAIKQRHNVRFIAPIDTDAGGTWIAVNQYGVSLCLLNNYGAQAQCADGPWVSRGQLVLELSHLPHVAAIINKIENTELHNYRPFDLLALSLDRDIRLLSWDGFRLTVSATPAMPLTSSSFHTEDVIQSRQQQFVQATNAANPQPSQLEKYHASHLPERGPFSVCMHRDNGQTVSFSHINVQTTEIRFKYLDGPPCSTKTSHLTTLEIEQPAHPHVA